MVGAVATWIRGSRLPCSAGYAGSSTPRRPWRGVLLLGGWLLAGWLLAGMPVAQAAPLTGTLEYTGRYTRTDGGERTQSGVGQAGTLRLRKSTYLWEPWFAQVNANLGFSLTSEQNRVEGEAARTSSGESLDGEVELALLPRSRFPLRLWVERRDSLLTNDNLVGVATRDRTLTRYGLDQRYRTLWGGSYSFRIEETVVEEVDDAARRDERLDWRLSGREQWGPHSLGVEFDQDRTRQTQPGERSTDRANFTVRHSYTAEEGNLRLNNLANANRRDTRTPLGTTQFDRDQLSTTARWSSGGERALRLNASVRALENRSVSGDRSSDSRLLASSLGASQRLSEYWRVSANSSLQVREDQRPGPDGAEELDEREISQQHGANLDFNSRKRSFAGFDHRWDAGLGMQYRADDDSENASVALDASQNLDRRLFEGGIGRLRGQFSQSVSHREASGDEALSSLQHSASLRWDQRIDDGSGYGELRATDSRQFSDGELERVFQQVNLQLSLQRRLSRDQSLSANATLQASRSGDGQTFDEWSPSSSLGLSYRQRGLFGMQRLRWRSDLRYTSDNLLFLVRREDDFEERDSIRWENRLDYDIGLLTTRFTATLSENDGVLNQAYRLTLSRRF